MMPPRISYSVIVSLPTAALAAEYIAWLTGGHIDAVIRGGASSGVAVILDTEPSCAGFRVMAQYTFDSRDVFERYVQLHAPALRAEGLARFGPTSGVTYQRLIGEIQ